MRPAKRPLSLQHRGARSFEVEGTTVLRLRIKTLSSSAALGGPFTFTVSWRLLAAGAGCRPAA
eukprot:COSAG01_NODE_32756_length_575_cov_23.859244_1_plen_63_part_00